MLTTMITHLINASPGQLGNLQEQQRVSGTTSISSLATYLILTLLTFIYLLKYIVKLKNKNFHLVMLGQIQLISFGYLSVNSFNIVIYKRLTNGDL